jgi:hypothetical protein
MSSERFEQRLKAKRKFTIYHLTFTICHFRTEPECSPAALRYE